jgi:hypothetical protein
MTLQSREGQEFKQTNHRTLQSLNPVAQKHVAMLLFELKDDL